MAATTAMPGVGVDIKGNPAVDPTVNVLQLVEAAVKRLDDLRVAESKRSDEIRATENVHLREIQVLENKRLDDLRNAENRRIDEYQALIVEYQEKLALAEAKRIDAIRAVDVAAVAVASERAGQQASVLAAQVAASADALRTLVATTADTMAKAQTGLTAQFNERISNLEKSSYMGAGRTMVEDPMMSVLVQEVKALRAQQSEHGGQGAGVKMSWLVAIGGIAMLGTIVSIIISLGHALK